MLLQISAHKEINGTAKLDGFATELPTGNLFMDEAILAHSKNGGGDR